MTVQPGTDLVPITTHPSPYILDYSDRCDKCGARAYVHVILKLSGTLFFCRHHWMEHKAMITPKSAYINDETQALLDHIKDDRHVTPGKEVSLPPRKTFG